MIHKAHFFQKVFSRIVLYLMLTVTAVSLVVGLVLQIISTSNFDYLIGHYYLQREAEKFQNLVNNTFQVQYTNVQEILHLGLTSPQTGYDLNSISPLLMRKLQYYQYRLIRIDPQNRYQVRNHDGIREGGRLPPAWEEQLTQGPARAHWIFTPQTQSLNRDFWILQPDGKRGWIGLGADWSKLTNTFARWVAGNDSDLYGTATTWLALSDSRGGILFYTRKTSETDYFQRHYPGFPLDLSKRPQYPQILQDQITHRRVYVSILPLGFSLGMGDSLYQVLELDRKIVMPIVRQNQLLFAFIMAVFTILMMLIAGLVFIRNLVRPLQSLKKAAEMIAHQEYGFKLPVERQDEFGDVSRAFHEMAEIVRHQQQFLEEEISMRTQELKLTLNSLQEREEQYYQEIQFAAAIQKGMMNPRSAWNAVRLQGLVRQMEEIGGDFVDSMSSEQRFLFYLSDVSGHGTPAALISIMTKMIIHYSFEAYTHLEAIVTATNQKINAIVRDEGISYKNFLTLFIAQVFPDYRFEYLSAGHVPAIKYQAATRKCIRLSTTSSMLGVFDQEMIQFKSREDRLDPGDKLVIFSDGFLDSQGQEASDFGLERVQELVTRHGDLDGELLLKALDQAWSDHFGDQPVRDDLSLLIIEHSVRPHRAGKPD